jgi:hypothetical protein
MEGNTLNEAQLTNPMVKQAITAMNTGNRSDWLALFTPDATLTDDGQKQDLVRWSDSEIFGTGQARLISIDREENNGLTQYGTLHSAQWGTFKTSSNFINAPTSFPDWTWVRSMNKRRKIRVSSNSY